MPKGSLRPNPRFSGFGEALEAGFREAIEEDSLKQRKKDTNKRLKKAKRNLAKIKRRRLLFGTGASALSGSMGVTDEILDAAVKATESASRRQHELRGAAAVKKRRKKR